MGGISQGQEMGVLGDSQVSVIVQVGTTMEESGRVGWLRGVLGKVLVMVRGVGRRSSRENE